jgi:hypothetical protein
VVFINSDKKHKRQHLPQFSEDNADIVPCSAEQGIDIVSK